MTLTQLHNLEEWMAALTSGRYKQGRGRLRSWLKQIQSPPVQTWTALGVAVQLFYTGPDLDQVIESQSDWTGLGDGSQLCRSLGHRSNQPGTDGVVGD